MKDNTIKDQGEFVQGSGNIFADLGLENPEMELAKAELAYAIRIRIRALELTQKQAAGLLKTDQAKISAIMSGKISGYSYDRLMRYLNKLNFDVTIIITSPKSDTKARIQVETA